MAAQEMVASKDVHLVILQNKIQSAKTQEERERFEKEQSELKQARELIEKYTQQIVTKCTDSPEMAQKILHGTSKSYSSKEYKEVVEYYREKCFNWHEPKYLTAMDQVYLFSNLLEEKVAVERIKNAIDEVDAAMKDKKEKETE